MNPRAPAAPPLLVARIGPARVWYSGASHGNLGDHVGDDPAIVARNRRALAARTDVPDPQRWVWIRQVHGVAVHTAAAPGAAPAPAADAPLADAPVADAVVTAEHGLALAVVTADCAPLVLASDDAVGVVHAGHRGLAGGVIEAAIARLRDIGTGDVRAFLGPCIRAARYEFGAGDLERLVAQFGPEVASVTHDGRPALDIPAGIRAVLEHEGVVAFDDSGICTSGSPGYFSYRRDAATGRQATVVVLP